MAIKASHFVSVSMSKKGLYPAKTGFGELCVFTTEPGPLRRVERIRHYTDVDGVVSDWGVTSEVAKAATAYYSQSPRPKKFAVAMRYESAQSAELVGGAQADLTSFTSINDASFSVEIDGSSAQVTNNDLTGAANLPAVAAILQAATISAFAGVISNNTSITITHDGSRFILTSPSTGETSTIGFATASGVGTDIHELLKWNQGSGTYVNGIGAETVGQSLSNTADVDDTWYGFLFTKEIRDNVIVNGTAAVMDAAAWAEARTKRFFNTSNDLAVIDPSSSSNIAKSIKAAGYGRTMTTFSNYPDAYPSASMAGRAFTVNFEQADSTITLNLKDAPGIVGEDLTPSQLGVLQDSNANAIINIGNQKKFTDSRMGDGRFFDEGHGIDWLVDSMQVAVYGYLSTTETKVKYTNQDLVKIEQQMDKVLAQAVRNGLGAPGETSDGRFLSRGYEITMQPVEDVPQDSIDARSYVGASFTLLGAGAIHSVEIKGAFV